MTKLAIDLYCGGGGASQGLEDAGFDDIIGVDNRGVIDYPFEHMQEDVFDIDIKLLKKADFIWASPPCQAYTWATNKKTKEKHPDLVDRTRRLLKKVGKPYTIENVPGSPIRKDLLLCGRMFDLKVYRHRYFEISGFICRRISHASHIGTVKEGKILTLAGHGGDNKKGNNSVEKWQEAIGINWIDNRYDLAQAIPPKYAEYIGKQFLMKNRKRLF